MFFAPVLIAESEKAKWHSSAETKNLVSAAFRQLPHWILCWFRSWQIWNPKEQELVLVSCLNCRVMLPTWGIHVQFLLYLNINWIESKEENGESGFRVKLSEENLEMRVFCTSVYLLPCLTASRAICYLEQHFHNWCHWVVRLALTPRDVLTHSCWALWLVLLSHWRF